MPVYNTEKFVGEAIESILNQTFMDFEFLIINDASTDKSEKIILSYQDPRIRYYKNKINMGVARTLNKGLKLAKAEFIARMDADDISLPYRLELQYKRMRKDKSLAMVASYFDLIDEDNRYIRTNKGATSSEEIYYKLQFHNCLGHPTVMYRKEVVLKEFNGYKILESEDVDLWLRISKRYRIVVLNEILVKVRRSEQGRTALFNNDINQSAVIVIKNNIQLLIGKSVSFEVARILAEDYDFYSSPRVMKEARPILEMINNKILETCPTYSDKSILKKCMKNKKRRFEFDLMITILFHSKMGSIFERLFRGYLKFKYLAIKKLHVLKVY